MSGEIIKLWFFSKIPQIYLVFPLNIKTLLISVIYDYFSMKYFIKSNTNQEHNDLLHFKNTKQKSRTIDIRNKKEEQGRGASQILPPNDSVKLPDLTAERFCVRVKIIITVNFFGSLTELTAEQFCGATKKKKKRILTWPSNNKLEKRRTTLYFFVNREASGRKEIGWVGKFLNRFSWF